MRLLLKGYIKGLFIEVFTLGAVAGLCENFGLLLIKSPPFFRTTSVEMLAGMEAGIFISRIFFIIGVIIIILFLRKRRQFQKIFPVVLFEAVSLVGLYYIKPFLGLLMTKSLFAFSIFPLATALTERERDHEKDETFIRGAENIKKEITAEDTFIKLAHKETRKNDKRKINLWKEVYIPFQRENQHILVAGSPGSGKTQIMYPLIKQVINRGDKVIIWDVKSTFAQSLLKTKKDIKLLAPWDARSVKWRIGADIKQLVDCKQMASILIPENTKDPQPFFLNSARNILEIILMHLDASEKEWGWEDIWAFLSQGKDKLFQSLSVTSEGGAAVSVLSGNSKASHDVYSTLISSCQSIRWLAKAWPKAEGISLREWCKSDKNETLILGGIPTFKDLAGTTANLALQIMVNEILSMPDNLNRRIWFFLDEFATLGRRDSLLEAFSVGRSKGLCVVVGIQDIGKIEHLYGGELTKSIVNTFSTAIFLRCSDAATSRWASEVLGEQEVMEQQGSSKSTNKSADFLSKDFSKSTSTQKSIRCKPVFLPSEIANFKDLSGVLRFSGWPTAKVTWPLRPIPQEQPVLIEADWVGKKIQFNNPVIDKNKEKKVVSEKQTPVIVTPINTNTPPSKNSKKLRHKEIQYNFFSEEEKRPPKKRVVYKPIPVPVNTQQNILTEKENVNPASTKKKPLFKKNKNRKH